MKILIALVLSMAALSANTHAADTYEQALSKLQNRFAKKDKRKAIQAKYKGLREQLKAQQKSETEALKN